MNVKRELEILKLIRKQNPKMNREMRERLFNIIRDIEERHHAEANLLNIDTAKIEERVLAHHPGSISDMPMTLAYGIMKHRMRPLGVLSGRIQHKLNETGRHKLNETGRHKLNETGRLLTTVFSDAASAMKAFKRQCEQIHNIEFLFRCERLVWKKRMTPYRRSVNCG